MMRYGKLAPYYLWIMMVALPQLVIAQNLTQTIRGTIIDGTNQQTIIGATIELQNTTFATTSNETGQFRLKQIPVGRYNLKVSYLGYQTIIIPEILVESSKEIIKNITLTTSSSNLEEVVVSAEKPLANLVGTQAITVEQTQRFATTFYDPARLAASFAGVVTQNDQANNIIVRGNSPNNTTWRLEGVEIVNPNHTPNAGTFSDRVTQSGGGVNILSTQLLGDSYFLKGNYPAEYNNSIGGILDMRLRKGNDEQTEFTGQIGILGIDLAAEGAFSKKSKASYLVNYRYSTLGLLAASGVELGDEEISFQDVAFNINLPTKRAGNFMVFGMWGESENLFEANRDSTLWEFQKDEQDIRFDSEMWAIGLTHTVSLGSKAFLKNVVVHSDAESRRDAFLLDGNLMPNLREQDVLKQTRTAIKSVLQYQINPQNRLSIGLYGTQLGYTANASVVFATDSIVKTLDGDGQSWLLQPYLSYHHEFSERLNVDIGLTYSYFTLNKTDALEPRLALQYDLNSQEQFTVAYGLHSRLQPLNVYFSSDFETTDFNSNRNYNTNLGMTKAHHYTLQYQNKLSQLSKLLPIAIGIELYYQDLFDVPIAAASNRTFSVLNIIEETVQDSLMNVGTGRNYGLEASWQQFLKKGYYYLLTGSVYESKYTAGDGIERDTRFNGNYAATLTGGKEYQWLNRKKEGQTKILGLNAKVIYLGGFRTSPIDAIQSAALGQTVFVENEAFSIQQSDVFKIDFRLYYKRIKEKYTSTLSLDIQNMTNAQNIAFEYFDTKQQQIVKKYQLGIIPIITYRVEF